MLVSAQSMWSCWAEQEASELETGRTERRHQSAGSRSFTLLFLYQKTQGSLVVWSGNDTYLTEEG